MFAGMNVYNLLIVLGVLAIIIEIILGAATGFELLVLGVVLAAGGVVGTFTNSVIASLSTVIVLIAGYIFFGRNMIKQALHVTTTKTNTDSIMGKQGVVISEINPDEPGQIKLEGEIWRAESDKKKIVGEKVIVKSVSGVTVKVEEKV